MIMPYHRDMAHLPQRDRVRYLEFAVPEIPASGTYDEREVVWHTEVLAVIHAHAYKKLRLRIFIERAAQVMVFQQ
jgi:hypothetical protein